MAELWNMRAEVTVFENEEFQDMVDRASTNPNAILCGTFHRYKVN